MDVNSLQAILANWKLLIGLLAVVALSFLIYVAIMNSQMKKLKSQLKILREDNLELIKRLEIISHGKVIS